MYFLNDFEMVPVAPIITGITLVFLPSTCVVFLLSGPYTYFKIFSASFLITFLSPEIAASINTHVPAALYRIYYYYYYYYYHHHHHHHRISHFSTLAGKYSHMLGCNNQQD